MKVYIMTDMEGVAGIQDSENWCRPPGSPGSGRYYEMGKALLTREVNAAVEGLFEAGATEILVADGHGAGGLQPLLLDERVHLLRGWPRGWPLELDASFGAVVWIGQHAKACTPFAHLAHTQSFRYIDQSINGLSVGEFGQFALCAGELGIPAIFGCGDEAFCQEAKALVPAIETVAVKRGITPGGGEGLDTAAYGRRNLSAVHLHPVAARRAILQGARRALARLHAEGAERFILRLAPPYQRVTRFRPDEPDQPQTVDTATHPDSVAGVLNQPFHPQPA
ncbi:MAG: M55 family metallopeptidase [Chloroflexi bacterium]|nr:M55 family metallopeptidase [Chloroflexota bacterium]